MVARRHRTVMIIVRLLCCINCVSGFVDVVVVHIVCKSEELQFWLSDLVLLTLLSTLKATLIQ